MVSEPPVNAPTADGVHERITVQVPLTPIGVPTAHEPPVTETPVPAAAMSDGVAAAVPVLVTVTVNETALPTVAAGNAPESNVNGPGRSEAL